MFNTISTRDKGRYSENFALGYLQKLGYILVERNFNAKVGEIDLIMTDGLELVFVEVKSVEKSAEFSLYESISPSKRKKLSRAVNAWLLEHEKLNIDHRVDFLGIIKKGEKVVEVVHEKHI